MRALGPGSTALQLDHFVGNIMYNEQVIFRYMYRLAYVYLTIISEKGGHEFEGKQGRICERVWSEETQDINCVINIGVSKIKEIM